ncbi:hypothetical protein [Megalodesulfovibrio paquesii]
MKHPALSAHITWMRQLARRQWWMGRLWIGLGLLLLLWANVGWVLTRLEHFAAPTAITITGDIANWCAFNGIVLFLAMCWMGSRNPWLERALGLDVLLLTHRRLAMVVLACFTGHALLRSWSISMGLGVGYDLTLLYRMQLSEWPLTLGRIVFFAMLVCAALAYAGQALGWLRFRYWKQPHLLFYALFPLGMLHGLLWGDDMGKRPLVELWWTLMALFLVDCLLRWRYMRRIRPRLRWTLAEIRRETANTATVCFSPEASEALAQGLSTRRPGQFGVLRVADPVPLPGMNEPHPFTFSGSASSPARPLQCTIKEAGEFTRTVATLPVGTSFVVEGPYGRFLDDVWTHNRLALLAGGVGITPFLSLVRSWAERDEALPAVLFWSNGRRADVFAVEELAGLCRRLPLTVVHCLSREPRGEVEALPVAPGLHWHAGRLDATVLSRWLCGDEGGDAWGCYACGPEPWLAGALAGLHQGCGIAPGRVRREHFFW